MGFNGWVIIDKPSGLSSRNVVDIISRSINKKKVGHAGTLDPLASGVLPIAIGEATKTERVLQSQEKSYTFTVKWGERTSTDDKLGKIISKNNFRPKLREIKACLSNFLGEVDQVPPSFSAIKINGKRAYSLAREEKNFEIKSRKIFISSLYVVKSINADYCTFSCSCSKGTYIRAIARDLGIYLKCYAHITSLRRTSIGKFSDKNAILLDLSVKLLHSSTILDNLISINDVLKGCPELKMSKIEENKLRNGQKLNLESLKYIDKEKMEYLINNKNEFMICKYKNNPVCFFRIDNNNLTPVRVFNL